MTVTLQFLSSFRVILPSHPVRYTSRRVAASRACCRQARSLSTCHTICKCSPRRRCPSPSCTPSSPQPWRKQTPWSPISAVRACIPKRHMCSSVCMTAATFVAMSSTPVLPSSPDGCLRRKGSGTEDSERDIIPNCHIH